MNFREGWRGHLWQGRFASFPLDEKYLLAAARYIEQNPVRAGLVARPWEYPWSSAPAHPSGRDDSLVKASPLLELVGDWKAFLATGASEDEVQQLRRHERTGRPLGGARFLGAVESQLGRMLRRGKPGPKRARIHRYCAVRNIGDSPPGTAQSGGESEEGRRPAPLGRVPAPQAWVRREGRALAARLVRVRGPSLRTKQRGRTCSQYSALLSKYGVP